MRNGSGLFYLTSHTFYCKSYNGASVAAKSVYSQKNSAGLENNKQKTRVKYNAGLSDNFFVVDSSGYFQLRNTPFESW